MIRFSHLKHFARSPLHFKHAVENDAPYDTPAIRIGLQVHANILETTRLPVFDGARRGKEWDAFKADLPGARILNAVENATADAVTAAIRNTPEAVRVLEGKRELTQRWSIGDVRCQGTPDVYTSATLTDLKTTRCADPRKFKWDVLRMGYHAQLSWYRNGLAESVGVLPESCYIVAAETAAPYPVTVFRVTDGLLAEGELAWRSWLEQYRVCRDTDTWPGYSIAPVDLEPTGNSLDELDWEGVEDAT